MKRTILVLSSVCSISLAQAQTFGEWFNQKKTQKKYLIQQIAALEAYKSVLSKGYEIVKDGTQLIGTITNGEFNLHADFFSGLKLVSPELKQKSRASDIVALRNQMELDRKDMERLISEKDFISVQEKQRLKAWYHNIAIDADADLEELKMLLTDGSLQLEEAERIKRIDVLFTGMQRKYSQQRKFSNNLKQTILQRQQKIEDSKILKKMYGL
ncbi:hypothetical protein [Chitinophaga polysaccharea]|uniref:hypothetical protein n=1 Tax=Chitinophaga polysaccharea TaxID=1293035 RepID=UPI001157930C|nr:hypothetical protein [Chitinophaga polysaccharea]